MAEDVPPIPVPSRWRVFPAGAAVISVMLAGCSATVEEEPEILPEVVEVVAEEIVEEPAPIQEEPPEAPPEKPPAAVSYGLQPEANEIIVLDGPWDLVKQAETSPEHLAPGLLILAINEFMDQNQFNAARNILGLLETYPMIAEDRLRTNLLKAQISQQENRHADVLETLETVDLERLQNPLLLEQGLQTLYRAQIAAGRGSDASVSLLRLRSLAEGPEQSNVQRQLLELLQGMSFLEHSLLQERVQHQFPELTGWIALANVLNGSSPEHLDLDYRNWRMVYPEHPATYEVLQYSLDSLESTRYRQVALLLPMSSGFGEAARAFHDGFMKARERDHKSWRPAVLLYDTGGEAGLSNLYYQAALQDGADFVVGPLGRQASATLLGRFSDEVNTLIIADIPDDAAQEHLFGISLSPEDEARRVAEKAWQDGHRHASVFRISDDWGMRVSRAFVKHWEMLGGVIIENRSFPHDISDYSRIIQIFLGLDRSNARHKTIQAVAGQELQFTPRRDQDMDFLFLAANADQARLVVPQLRFFQAHDLPMYATSYIYGGKPNPALDADLDGLIFGDMKWMLEGVELYRRQVAEQAMLKAMEDEAELLATATIPPEDAGPVPAVPETPATGESTGLETATGPADEMPEIRVGLTLPEEEDAAVEPAKPEDEHPYRNTALDRLYALGLQSYQLIAKLDSLRKHDRNRFIGEAMTVSIAENGKVIHHPVWLQFQEGLPERFRAVTPGLPELPVLLSNSAPGDQS